MSNVLAFERVRAFTMRSTYVFPIVGVLLAWGAALLFSYSASGYEENISFTDFAGQGYTPLSVLFITLPFAQAFGHEYRDGTMRLTLSEFPHRTQVFIAKLLVPAGIAAVAAVASIVGMALVGRTGPVDGFDALPMLSLRAIGYTIIWGLFVAAITVLTRNIAAGVAGVLVWALILENLIGGLLSDKLPWIGNLLPLSNVMGWFATGQVKAGIISAAAAAVVTIAAWAKFTRTDA